MDSLNKRLGEDNVDFQVSVRHKPLIMFVTDFSSIEPLGPIYLGGLAKELGYDVIYEQVRDHNFDTMFERISQDKPNFVGDTLYTGNHQEAFNAFDKLKRDNPGIATIAGGFHPTYFPLETALHFDYVVTREGFAALRKILRGEVSPGIIEFDPSIPITDPLRQWPKDDRDGFYRDSPDHEISPFYSFITMTGCPYKCTYCYNSSNPSDLRTQVNGTFIPLNIAKKDCASHNNEGGIADRLFPFHERSAQNILNELQNLLKKHPHKKKGYSQDDVHMLNTHGPSRLLADGMHELGIKYHAQMRVEMVVEKNDHTPHNERLDLVQYAGCDGLTMALESADPIIRKEILDRDMPQEAIYASMRELNKRGFRVRTEQITALPYGSTSVPTLMNLEQDLALLELNINLRESTGKPDMAWASAFAPYIGSKLGNRAIDEGHYSPKDNNVEDTFFGRSVLRFPKEWVGPSLRNIKDDESIWLQERFLELYRDQNAELVKKFNFCFYVPKGTEFARDYLTLNSPSNYSDQLLTHHLQNHLESISNRNTRAQFFLDKILDMKEYISSFNGQAQMVEHLAPYFALIPQGEKLVKRYLVYGENKEFSSKTLSDATRHHLYDNELYMVGDDVFDSKYAPRSNVIDTKRLSDLKV